MKQLSERQYTVLKFMWHFHQQEGRCPTGPEVARGLGYQSYTSAYQFIEALQRKGCIDIQSYGFGRPYAIRFTDRTVQNYAQSFPVLGSIPAGPVEDSFDDITDQISELKDLLPMIQQGDFLLVVRGDSMINDRIMPGQYAIVRPGIQPNDGDICAVWVEGEGGTLKRIFREGSRIRLVPSNPKYSEATYPADKVIIQGILIASVNIWRFRER